MRLYAVVTPPIDVVADLARVVGDARAEVPAAPWTEPAMWSLPLARFGNLGLHELTVVKTTLSEIGTYCPPLHLWLSGGAARPHEVSAEEVEVGIAGDVDELWSLARAVVSMVQRHGLFLDRRSFHPAVTVAQGAQELFDARPALAVLAAYRSLDWIAAEMRFVRLIPSSADVPGIGDYEDVARYPFSAPPENETPTDLPPNTGTNTETGTSDDAGAPRAR